MFTVWTMQHISVRLDVLKKYYNDEDKRGGRNGTLILYNIIYYLIHRVTYRKLEHIVIVCKKKKNN